MRRARHAHRTASSVCVFLSILHRLLRVFLFSSFNKVEVADSIFVWALHRLKASQPLCRSMGTTQVIYGCKEFKVRSQSNRCSCLVLTINLRLLDLFRRECLLLGKVINAEVNNPLKKNNKKNQNEHQQNIIVVIDLLIIYNKSKK